MRALARSRCTRHNWGNAATSPLRCGCSPCADSAMPSTLAAASAFRMGAHGSRSFFPCRPAAIRSKSCCARRSKGPLRGG
eukprot:3320401-Alexandrium_andersonii.AAC.1